jgi:hypothetical protein
MRTHLCSACFHAQASAFGQDAVSLSRTVLSSHDAKSKTQIAGYYQPGHATCSRTHMLGVDGTPRLRITCSSSHSVKSTTASSRWYHPRTAHRRYGNDCAPPGSLDPSLRTQQDMPRNTTVYTTQNRPQFPQSASQRTYPKDARIHRSFHAHSRPQFHRAHHLPQHSLNAQTSPAARHGLLIGEGTVCGLAQPYASRGPIHCDPCMRHRRGDMRLANDHPDAHRR